jgi:hypothetical protein
VSLYDKLPAVRRARQRVVAKYPYVWTRRHLPSGYEGKRCRKVGRAPSNMVRVEFEDGKRFLVHEDGLEKRGWKS